MFVRFFFGVFSFFSRTYGAEASTTDFLSRENDGRDDAPEEEEQVSFDDDDAEHTMSDLPVLMEIAWPSLAEGCGKRPCGAHFSSCRLSCFFSTFLLVGNIGGACVEWRRALCTVRSTFSDTLLREHFSWSFTAPSVHSLLVG